MKYSVKLSHAVHILVFIYLSEGLPLSSDKIAESIHTNPGCVRQIMSALRNAKLMKSTTGHPKPELAREPETITLFDIYIKLWKVTSHCFIWIHIQIRNVV